MSTNVSVIQDHEISFSYLSRCAASLSASLSAEQLSRVFHLPPWSTLRPYLFLPCLKAENNTIDAYTDITHTLLPYYASCMPHKVLEKYLAALHLTTIVPKKVTLEIQADYYDWPEVSSPPAWTLKEGPAALRACPLCMKKDYAASHFVYLHRSHQLQGMLYCPVHPSQVLLSLVPEGSPYNDVTATCPIVPTLSTPLTVDRRDEEMKKAVEAKSSLKAQMALVQSEMSFLLQYGHAYGGLENSIYVLDHLLTHAGLPPISSQSSLSLAQLLKFWHPEIIHYLLSPHGTPLCAPVGTESLAALLSEHFRAGKRVPHHLILIANALGHSLADTFPALFPECAKIAPAKGISCPYVVDGKVYASLSRAASDRHTTRYSVSQSKEVLPSLRSSYRSGPYTVFGEAYPTLSLVASRFGITEKYLSTEMRKGRFTLEGLIIKRYYRITPSPHLPEKLILCRRVSGHQIVEAIPKIRSIHMMLSDLIPYLPASVLQAYRKAAAYSQTHPVVLYTPEAVQSNDKIDPVTQ